VAERPATGGGDGRKSARLDCHAETKDNARRAAERRADDALRVVELAAKLPGGLYGTSPGARKLLTQATALIGADALRVLCPPPDKLAAPRCGPRGPRKRRTGNRRNRNKRNRLKNQERLRQLARQDKKVGRLQREYEWRIVQIGILGRALDDDKPWTLCAPKEEGAAPITEADMSAAQMVRVSRRAECMRFYFRLLNDKAEKGELPNFHDEECAATATAPFDGIAAWTLMKDIVPEWATEEGDRAGLSSSTTAAGTTATTS
jgi:hypothetical protein